MEIKVGRWYQFLSDASTVFVVDIDEKNSYPILFIQTTPYSCRILKMSREDFEASYIEYDGGEDQKHIHITKKLAEYYRSNKYFEQERRTDAEKIRKLERENKILKVLASNKRQKIWIEGEIIPGRVAECRYCEMMIMSETTLPFFKERPEWDTDEYYCGCRGFD